MYNLFSNVKSDRQFNATTGLSKVEFYELVYEFEEVEAQQKAERLASGPAEAEKKYSPMGPSGYSWSCTI